MCNSPVKSPVLVTSRMFGDLTDALSSTFAPSISYDAPTAPTVGPVATSSFLSRFVGPTTSMTQILGVGLLAVAAFVAFRHK